MRRGIAGVVLIAVYLLSSSVLAQGEAGRLNNFVTELVRVQGNVGAKRTFTFDNPREGWVFFRTSAQLANGDTLRVFLTPGPEKAGAPLIFHKGGGPATQEAMRYLPKGTYKLRLSAVGRARLTSLIVRTIPELIYASYRADPHLKAYGPYDWGFLKRVGMLDSCNVISATGPKVVPSDWVKQGKRIVHHASVPGLNGKKISAEEVYQYWSKVDRAVPESNGITMDEFYVGPGWILNRGNWVEAIQHLSEERPERLFYPYIAGDATGLRSFVEPLLRTRCRFAYERYPCEMRTEAQARAGIVRWLRTPMLKFRSYAPEFQNRCIYVMGFLCGPNETCNTNPGVNFKTFMDMQFHLMAGDAALDGLYGVEMYLSSYCDEEYLRWCAKLFRHYCIEGNTRRLSRDPYMLTHIVNPDFEDELRGWRVTAAEPGHIARKQMAGYGWLQGRGWLRGVFPRESIGDTFLWMKRSAKAPNIVAQRIRDLKPGQPYSLKMYVGDLQELTREQKHVFSVRLEGVEMLEKECVRDVFKNCYAHTIKKYGKKNTYFSWRRLVFRPKSSTALLTISDWASEKDPGAPVGQELIFNFIEIEPYLIP